MMKSDLIVRWLMLSTLAIVELDATDDKGLPPYLVQTPPARVVCKVGERAVLVCEAGGTPLPTIHWTKNGSPLDVNNRTYASLSMSIEDSTGALKRDTIVITPRDIGVEGYYRCSAQNKWGTVVSDIKQVILARINPLPPKHHDTFTAVEGDPLTLSCTRTESVPSVAYMWGTVNSTTDSNFVPISESSRIGVTDSGDLFFAYVTVEDNLMNRLYTCRLYNRVLNITYGGSFYLLKVTPRPISSVEVNIQYGSGFPETIALKGSSVSLRCIFSGKPTPDIHWKRNSITLTGDTSRYSITKFGARLTISDVRESDADEYSCWATNEVNTGSGKTAIRVVVAPQFQPGSLPQNINVTHGSTVNISCRTDAQPTAKVQWFKNGDPLQYNDRMQVTSDQQTLTITGLCGDEKVCQYHDSMVISCNASNEYGYAYASGYINVLQQTTNMESSSPSTTTPSTTTTDLVIIVLIVILWAVVIEHAVVIVVARYKAILCFAARPSERSYEVPVAGTRTPANYTTINVNATEDAYTRANASNYVELYTTLNDNERSASTAYVDVRS